MNLLSLNKALVWKEWRQNRLLLSLFVILMSLPIANNLRLLLMYTSNPPVFINGEPLGWKSAIMSNGIYSYIDRPGVLLVLALGLILILQERMGNNLDYLLANPVSRQKVSRAKFFIGALAVVTTMIIYTLFLAIIWSLLPVRHAFYFELLINVINTFTLLALFSVGFYISSFAGSVISAILLTLGALVVPAFVGSTVTGLLSRFFGVNHWSVTYVNKIFNFLVLPSNIVDSLGEAKKVAAWEIPALIAIIFVLYYLANSFFEKNMLENNGRFLAIGKNYFPSKAILVLSLYVVIMFSKIIFKEYSKQNELVFIGIIITIVFALWQIFSFFLKKFNVGKPGGVD